MGSYIIGKCRKAQQEDREASSKGGLPSKFIQSQINVILCSNEKPDVGVGAPTQCSSLFVPQGQLWCVCVYDTPSHALVDGGRRREDWSYVPIFFIFPPELLREKESVDSSAFPVLQKKKKGECSFFSIEHPPPALKSEDHMRRQDLVNDNDSQNKSIK